MKYRVKKRWPLLGVAIIAAIGVFIFGKCFLEVDYLGYREILEKANPALALEKDLTYRASQQRKGVKKEFWHIKNDQRLEAIMNCSETELVYEKEGNEQVVVENMKNVRCLLQEELFYLAPNGEKISQSPDDPVGYTPQQTVRYVEAETAKYHYTTEILDAAKVKMQLYTFPGHELPRSVVGAAPTMSGNATMVMISIVEKGVKFKADKFKGSMF